MNDDAKGSDKMLVGLRALVEGHAMWAGELSRLHNQGIVAQDEAIWVLTQLRACHERIDAGLTLLMGRSEGSELRERLLRRLVSAQGGEGRSAHRIAALIERLSPGTEDEPIHDTTRLYIREWLDAANVDEPMLIAAHLFASYEANKYELRMLAQGLDRAGIAESDVRIVAEYDVAPQLGSTLELALRSTGAAQDLERVTDQIEASLAARERLHDGLVMGLLHRRVAGKLDRINAKQSLIGEAPRPDQIAMNPLEERGLTAYRCVEDRLGISFHVEHLPQFKPEVVDPRIIRIQPGKTNERHKHAHETIYAILSGVGEVSINKTVAKVKTGDVAFIPRWAMHQARNVGPEPLVILGVTDYNLTGVALMDQYLKHARLDKSTANLSRGGMQTSTGKDWSVYRELMLDNLSYVLEQSHDFIADFLDRLFQAHPELALLGGARDASLKRVFQLGLEAMADKVVDTSWFHQTGRALGRLLAEAGVTEPMVHWGREIAMTTLRSHSGSSWSPEIEEAWSEMFSQLAQVLLAGAQGVRIDAAATSAEVMH